MKDSDKEAFKLFGSSPACGSEACTGTLTTDTADVPKDDPLLSKITESQSSGDLKLFSCSPQTARAVSLTVQVNLTNSDSALKFNHPSHDVIVNQIPTLIVFIPEPVLESMCRTKQTLHSAVPGVCCSSAALSTGVGITAVSTAAALSPVLWLGGCLVTYLAVPMGAAVAVSGWTHAKREVTTKYGEVGWVLVQLVKSPAATGPRPRVAGEKNYESLKLYKVGRKNNLNDYRVIESWELLSLSDSSEPVAIEVKRKATVGRKAKHGCDRVAVKRGERVLTEIPCSEDAADDVAQAMIDGIEKARKKY